MERHQLINLIKRLEPEYYNVSNFEDFTFIELKDLYLEVVKDKGIAYLQLGKKRDTNH
jgi:hypothetical protein